MPMLIGGLVVMTIGAIGVSFAVYEEWRTHEPVWKLAMKIAALAFGVGGVLFGVAMA